MIYVSVQKINIAIVSFHFKTTQLCSIIVNHIVGSTRDTSEVSDTNVGLVLPLVLNFLSR